MHTVRIYETSAIQPRSAWYDHTKTEFAIALNHRQNLKFSRTQLTYSRGSFVEDGYKPMTDECSMAGDTTMEWDIHKRSKERTSKQ
jgi:hypothetical protein